LVNQGGGWLVQQAALTADDLAHRLQTLTRNELVVCAEKAYAMRKTNATHDVVQACEALATQRGSGA
jgi:UDP-N-acetylglucosamine--N-acetylmuramyl-(pentapeptide) pyrophosphoryl-undecaprenol N-acetylglucosamine transferase